MKKEYLPIGSVVLLTDAKKKLMITGFYVKPNSSDIYYDYLGCLFPEGIMSENDNYLFNNEQIEKVCHEGLNDNEEKEFKKRLYEILKGNTGKKEKNTIISIPVDLYDKYGKEKNDIISIPLDEYNKKAYPPIVIPADAYAKACGKDVTSSEVISVPLEAYEKYNAKDAGASVISIPETLYNKAIGRISIPVDDYARATANINIPMDAYVRATANINIPMDAYVRATANINIPLEEYNRLMERKSVISINAQAYGEYLNKQQGIISLPLEAYEREKRTIRIPLNVYNKLTNRNQENVISIPLNVYESMLGKDDKDVISIPLDEYERITGGKEENGTIVLPADVYNEFLRKEKPEIESKPAQIIEIPYDLYTKATEDNK